MKTRQTYKLLFGYLGIFLIFVGAMTLLPLLLLLNKEWAVYDSQFWINFFIPGMSAIVAGFGLTFLLKGTKDVKLGKHQDAVLLVLIWIFAIVVCAIPFLLKGDMTFTEAVFETTSGFSTIGLTVYNDFESHLYVFFRSLLTLIGGVGLVLIVTTAVSDKINIYAAEGHNDKLLPNLRKSASLILGIYVGLICFGTCAYMIAGVSFFDALVHSISAVATGGFSSKAGGLVELEAIVGNEAAIEIISIVLMILGSINFLTHFFLITGRFSKAAKDCELKLLGFLIVIFVPVFFISTLLNNTADLTTFDSFRHGAFTFVSSITTTGFSTVSNVVLLGESTMFLIIVMNVIGGGAGSTAGGVKQYRVVVAAKSFFWATRARLANPRMVYPHFVERLGEDKEIEHNDTVEAFGYIILYLCLMFLGALFVTSFAKDMAVLPLGRHVTFGDGLFEFSNAISSTGLSNGITAAAAYYNNYGVLWTLIIGMFAGRLEILSIYFAFYRIVRDIIGKETI